jgi:MFS family permease
MLLDSWRTQFPEIDAMGHQNLAVFTRTGTTIGCWNLGCMAGAVLTFFLCNVLGRKGCIITGLSIEIVGKLIQCSSFSLGQYIAGRVIAGVGNGYEVILACMTISTDSLS